MNSKSNRDSQSDEFQMQHPLLRSEPLLSRIDPLLRGQKGGSGITCQLFAKNTSNGFSLDPPFFTRLTADAGLSIQVKRQLLNELAPFGVAWVGDSLGTLDRKQADSTDEPFQLLPRIASLQLDEHLDVDCSDQAAAIASPSSFRDRR